MAKKKKKQTESEEPRVVGRLGASGEIAPFESARVLGRVDDKGNRVAYIQAQKEDIAPVKDTWFKNGMDDSGYAYTGTLDKINRFNASVLMTGVDILGNIGLGITKPVEGVGDFVQNRTADVLDFFGGDKAAEKIRKSAKKEWGVNRELEQSLASDNGMGIDDMSFLGQKGKSIPQGLGSVLLASATGGAGGAVFGTTAGASATSLGFMGVGAAGNAEQEALEQGATRKEARMYGLISGVGETLSEMMFGGLSRSSQVLGIGSGVFDSFDDAVASQLTKKINNKIVKNLLQAGFKATGEGVEEVVSGLFDAVGKKLTYMKDEDIKKLIEDENLLDSFLSGAFSAAISQAPGYVQSITTTDNGKVRLKNQSEIRDYITNLNAQEQQVVEQEIQDRINEEGKITKKRRIEIEKQVIEDLDRGYISADKIEKTLGENYNQERDTRLAESFNERARKTQAYENDISKYDEKQAKVIQKAIDSGLLNNSNKTHDFVDLIAKISADKGIDFDFTNNQRIKDTGFAVEGKTVNGFIKDGKVTLNLESNQALNKTVGHEITHVLEGTELYNNLQDSLKSFIGEREWNNRISELEKTYKNVKGANIENELTSDLVGEYVFNDEKFVKSLSTKNPNLFQKIFDEIKYMVKIATAGSKEARDLEKVKRAFEKAYRETSKTQQGTQYSLEQNYRGSHQIEDGTSIVDLDLNNIRNQIEEIDGYITRETEKDFNKLKKILNNPEGNVKIYRAAPVGELNNGDWVTTDKSYAKNVANNNGGKVYEYEVKANELNYPSNIKELPSLHRLSSFQYTGENQQNVKYSLTDNQGRELSEQQQEFFKDSKVRDENGQLIEVYHGSPNEFTVFDKNKMKTGATMYASSGDGFYFTDSEAKADKYSKGGTKYSTYLNITNPFVVENKISNEAADLLYKFSQQVIENHPEATQKSIGAYELFDKNDIGQRSGTAILSNVVSEYGNEFTEFLKENGYDGIKSSVTDYDNVGEQYNYVAFDSNQIKNVTNENPTDNVDIRYQLGNNEVAPTSGWNVRSEDVRLQSAFKETIAPLQEQVQELTKTIQNIVPSRALTEEEANEYATQTQEAFENEAAPIRNNLTPEENQRMDMLELLERNNMMNDERRYEKEQLENKNNPTYEEEATPGQALSDIRDVNEVGSPKIKAYQYEHPEVKPYFREEARGMLSDLRNSQKGGRYIYESQERGQGTNYDVLANKRFTSPEIAELLDSKWGYTYDDIEKGLNAIIEDHGAENIAVAKRIELVLDDNLRNGYTDWQTGMEIPPNQQYLNMLAEQEWQNYFDDINSQYPLEQLQEPQYNLEDEETDFSDVKIDKDLQDMTVDDLNLEPFLQGLVKSSENQAERQQLRNELNEKREVKVPKNVELNKAKNRSLGLLVNEFAVVDDYAKRTGNKNIKFKADTYNNYQAIAQSNIETAQTDINGKAIGRSGNSIFEEAKSLGLEDTFDEYLKQWANVDRAKQGKGAANYSAKESYKIVKEMEAKNPRLKDLGKDMWQYYRNARHNLRDAGIISQEVSDMLGRMYPHYTPYISENIENYFTDKGELKPKATIKRAKGGAAIGSLLSAEEAMQRYTKSEFNTIFGNDLYREIVNTSNDIVQLGGDDRGMQFVNADNLYADKNGYYLTAYEDGNPITAKISEDMYRTLTRESRNRISDIENTFSMVTKPLQAASKLRRNILTSWSPTFIAKNFIKDFQEGIFNSKYTKDFIKNYPTAFKELATNTELAQQFKSLYGSGLTMGQYDIDANNYNPSGKNKNFLKGIKNANELIELAPRYAEFKASIDHGASIQEAMYNAREVTTNFSRGGTLAKALNRNGFTFLNSSIQGFDKFIRNFSGENGAKGIVNSLAKAAIFGIAPAVFNELAFGSGDDKDEDYEALPDYIKDNYYIIKLGKNQGEYDDNGNIIKIGGSTFLRIPKGRVLSVFGSAARRTIEAMEGEENAFEGYWNNVQQQIGINNPEENNIFAPLIQAMGGRKLDSGQTAGSAWYGGDIIPSRLQKERPEDQYDASIDKLSIWLGQHTGISPYKINYVLDQYTGGIGDIGLPMITEEANSDGSIIAPIKDQFTADTITDNKYVSEFYDTKGKLYTGSKATDEDVLKNKYMNSISSEMAKLYAERREVQADTSLTKQQKYAKSQAIKAEINRLAKEGMDNYNDIIMSNNYAKIGDTEYYKNANGQWTKVTDDVASLGLDTEEKSEYYKVKNDIYTTKKNNDGNDKPLVIQDIVNSNLTPDAKVNLYTSNYKDDLVQPLVDSGMNVDSYLTFKSQSFTADKDSNGKSISGSKKQKVFDYINSMNVPYEQKLILAKSEYNSFNDNNYEIIEYIENTGMDYDERIQLYKSLGFKVDGDSISW